MSARLWPSGGLPEGCPADPMEAYRQSGYARADRVGAHRGISSSAGAREREPHRVEELLARSHRLGADRRNTNYAGGNASAKGVETDPASGERRRAPVGQGLGRRSGHADREWPGRAPAGPVCVRCVASTRDPSTKTRWWAAMDYCLHGRGGAAPSIDTAMHALVDAAHVDHLHPDSAIAIATSATGSS